MLHPFLYRGRRYNSKSELLKALEKEFVYIDTSITAFGKKYNSLSEIAHEFDIGAERLRKALKNNNDIEFLIEWISKRKRTLQILENKKG